jgi:hypothetical protein
VILELILVIYNILDLQASSYWLVIHERPGTVIYIDVSNPE